jgi:hypothetical protein
MLALLKSNLSEHVAIQRHKNAISLMDMLVTWILQPGYNEVNSEAMANPKRFKAVKGMNFYMVTVLKVHYTAQWLVK